MPGPLRPIHIAHLDKARPVVVLTRERVRPYLTNVTIAYVTSTVRGLSTEVAVGSKNQLDHEGVISLDNVTTIAADRLGRQIGWLQPEQEPLLTAALHAAYDLQD